MPKQVTEDTKRHPLPPFAGAGDSMNRALYKSMQQAGYSSAGNNPDAFVALPESVVEKIGLYTHMGARIECAALSRLLYEDKQQDTSQREIAFRGEESFEKPEGTFILSMESIARDLWQRWFHEDGEGDKFERFYDRLRRAVGRLEDDGWVRRNGHPCGEKCYGYVWTFKETFLGGAARKLPQTHYTGARLLHSGARPEEEATGMEDGLVNATDVIGEAFVASNPKEYRHGEIVTSLTRRGRVQWDGIYQWCRQVAEHGASGPRFTSIGAWRARGNEQGLTTKPHTVPWITMDVDRSDLFEALDVAKRIVRRMDSMGVPLHKVHVSFSGKKGFHIRVPSGMAGAPVFANGAETERILRRFINHVSDEKTDLEVADPRQNIRLIGSVRENGYHVVAWDAEDFVKPNLALQHILNKAKSHHPYEIGHIHPLTVAPVPELVRAMVGAMDTTRRANIPSFEDTKSADEGPRESGVMRRAMEGCEEGVVWWDKGDKIHRGRSKLLFMAGCHLLRKHNRHTAWSKLQEVNEKCDPPMGQRELKGRFESAKRNVSPRQ